MSVRNALLQLLAGGEAHGYQLKVDFENGTGGIWPLNVGQVYMTLDRLVRDGLITESGGADNNQKLYRITEDGRGEVKAWLASSPVDTAPPRDELLMKVLLAMAQGDDVARGVIDDQRAALLNALQAGRRRQRQRVAAGERAQQLAHDALLTRIEADVSWLERCEAQLRSRTSRRSS